MSTQLLYYLILMIISASYGVAIYIFTSLPIEGCVALAVLHFGLLLLIDCFTESCEKQNMHT